MTALATIQPDPSSQRKLGPQAATGEPSAQLTSIPDKARNDRGGRLFAKLPPGRAVFEAMWPPVVGILAFLTLWSVFAPMVQTSLGALPGPGDVWEAFKGLMVEYSAARADAAAAEAAGGMYSGPPTFIDQILTSLKTVGMGFVMASVFAWI